MAPKPIPSLLALATLISLPTVGVPLVLAQTQTGAPPTAEVAEPQSATPQPESVAPSRPARAAAAAAIAPTAPPPLPSLPSRSTAVNPAPPLRPGVAQLQHQPAKSIDASLDALVRERVITPSERVRVRGGMVIPQNAASRQSCSSGALSEQECSLGVVFRGRGRLDGGREGGPANATDYGPESASGTVAGLGGQRFGFDASPLPPITVPVSALLAGAGGNFRLTDVFRVTPRPGPIRGNGNARLLFPLVGSAVTTSGFGWRLHPLMGTWLMHAGRDLAAPEGTPVVAALSGRVVSSGVAGGYGLAVEIEHDRPRRRTLYGHLSELYVKEGETVRQGDVIGRVGSTGLSTGPHLHFELRLPQEGGWVATDPGDMDSGGSMVAALPGMAGPAGPRESDAVAMLMGQLIQTLERPRSPLPLPGESGRLPTPAASPMAPASPSSLAPPAANSPARRG